ncbi:MAG: glycosyltransferase, partial [Phycisphaeraceae bacterium]
MRVVMFYHSLISDWNHGNAHFLRGIVSELLSRGHEVIVYEPRNGWSRRNLIAEHGGGAVTGFRRAFPHLSSTLYNARTLNLDRALAGADVVMVHEWNEPALVAAIGAHRRRRGHYRLLFHDTHHRAVSTPGEIGKLDLSSYDGVLAFGRVIGEVYRSRGWTRRVWAWHEAADIRTFHPRSCGRCRGDVVWIGNWGDEERTAELEEYLIEPVRRLGLRAAVYGVRYPESAIRALDRAGIAYKGWLPNHRVPEVFASYR